MRWVEASVPTWIVGVVLILGIPTLSVLLKLVIDRKFKSLRSDTHNDVAGFLVAVVAVVYTVIVGFTIVSLYEGSVTANQDVSTEASDLLQLHQGNFVLGPTTSARIDKDVIGYGRSVVDNWSIISQGNVSPQVQKKLNDIYETLATYHPRTAAQVDYLNESVTAVANLSEARSARTLEARDAGSLPIELWMGILLTSIVTLGFALLFRLEDIKIACAMVAGVAVVLAVNLFILVELGYPFVGSVAVGPERFAEVVRLVGG